MYVDTVHRYCSDLAVSEPLSQLIFFPILNSDVYGNKHFHIIDTHCKQLLHFLNFTGDNCGHNGEDGRESDNDLIIEGEQNCHNFSGNYNFPLSILLFHAQC